MPKAQQNPFDRAEELIANFKQEFEDARKQWERSEAIHAKAIAEGKPHWYGHAAKPRINWDEEWDGMLVERVRNMAAAGFYVTRFYRKQKIYFQMPKDKTRAEVVQLLMDTFGDEWRGLQFKPAAIWWGKTSNGRWY